ncbi:uncharacterized protein Z519_10223 [Cladophialophora bantiana CBS 173.52]|uniref:Uncharacterized protein n=1 Tax=Cladophialophora bantiana (strain ATCC 10958 / CBS 173.52 / CDC B-1940 / NIH 8579) TaxID=1442370 RepID=A0A0D2HXS0_CLAB1|nr:uncharacterized protein Z519_10223 [Cladophialophora bantiana CBS 173.52]KIW89369.1 hypothetical protein Z519_10223 [Cladophialophora bantiana CBS 173.52]
METGHAELAGQLRTLVSSRPEEERRDTSKRAILESFGYYQMRELTDVALQQLYWACRRRTGFPGDIPDESKGGVSTDDILKGLGLMKPEFDELNFPKETEPLMRSTCHGAGQVQQRRFHAITPCDDTNYVEKQSVASTGSTSSSSPQTANESVQTSITTNTRHYTNTHLPFASDVVRTPPSEEIDMKAQFELASSLSPAPRPGRVKNRTHSRDGPLFNTQEHVMEPHLDVDAFVDMSLCTSPTLQPHPQYYGQSTMSFSMPEMAMLPQLPLEQQAQQPSRDLVYDSYLSAWPGPVATGHRSSAPG